MPPTTHTRKPVDKLRPVDFDVFPIWEYADDEDSSLGQDETWVRPVRKKIIPVGAYAQHVASDFLFGSGLSCRGFVTVNSVDGAFEAQNGGVLLTKSGYFVLPGMAPSSARKKKEDWALRAFDRIEKAFGAPYADIEELLVRLRVPFAREKRCRFGYIYA